MPDINDIILTELQGLRKDVTEGFSEHGQRLVKIETQLTAVVGPDGNGGRLKEHEDDIASLQKTKWYGLGALGVLSLGSSWVLKKFGL